MQIFVVVDAGGRITSSGQCVTLFADSVCSLACGSVGGRERWGSLAKLAQGDTRPELAKLPYFCAVAVLSLSCSRLPYYTHSNIIFGDLRIVGLLTAWLPDCLIWGQEGQTNRGDRDGQAMNRANRVAQANQPHRSTGSDKMDGSARLSRPDGNLANGSNRQSNEKLVIASKSLKRQTDVAVERVNPSWVASVLHASHFVLALVLSCCPMLSYRCCTLKACIDLSRSR